MPLRSNRAFGINSAINGVCAINSVLSAPQKQSTLIQYGQSNKHGRIMGRILQC
jgi:hypothetical protein